MPGPELSVISATELGSAFAQGGFGSLNISILCNQSPQGVFFSWSSTTPTGSGYTECCMEMDGRICKSHRMHKGLTNI